MNLRGEGVAVRRSAASSQANQATASTGMITVQRGLVALLLAAILLNFFVAGWAAVIANANPAETDQAAYLKVGLRIRDRVKLTDGNRHPLYPALLSLGAERDSSYFTRAKLVSLAIATLGLAVVFWLARRLYNTPVALGATFVLSVAAGYVGYAGRAQAEALLAVLYFVAWYCVVRAADDARWWPVGGVFAGLAYLTKVSGQVLLVGFLVAAGLLYGRRAARQRGVWLFVVCYVLAAMPLFVYNYQERGDPLYNFSTTHTPWLDVWDEKYVEPDDARPTMMTYLQTHSASDIVGRLRVGMQALPAWFAEGLEPAGSDLRGVAGNRYLWVAAAALLLLSLAIPSSRTWLRAYYRDNRSRLLTFLPVFGLTSVGLAWLFPVSSDVRHVVPLIPIICVLVVDFAYRLVQTAVGYFTVRRDVARWVRRLAVAAIYVGVLGWSLTSAWHSRAALAMNPFDTDRAWHASREGVLEWLAQRVTDDEERVVYGPSHYLPTWKPDNIGSLRAVPSSVTKWYELESLVREMEARYMVLTPDMLENRGQAFHPFVRSDDTHIYIDEIPPGWRLAYVEPNDPPYVIAVLEAPAPLAPADVPHPMEVTFDERIQLLGYDLTADGGCSLQTSEDAGQRLVIRGTKSCTLNLDLYWQALAPIERDYTVFVHLLDETLQIQATADGRPVYGRAPTSTWTPDRIVIDPHPVTIDAPLPAGVYQFGVGLYLFETGERLGATGPQGWLPENRVLLGSFAAGPEL